jgi:hypothetical protein
MIAAKNSFLASIEDTSGSVGVAFGDQSLRPKTEEQQQQDEGDNVLVYGRQ